MKARKIINDPVFGFITIPTGLLLDLIGHPVLLRLARIKQLGLSFFVYPGAQHSRFQHSLGAYYLMSEAIKHLSMKGNELTPDEAEGVQAAILLHDIGHGPFSHVLEHTLVHNISHEEISLLLMQVVNEQLGGRLELAIQIFQNHYHKHFLHQLVSGQLDMDRLDYLRRDSFYTGVTEGNIGSARIIKMLDVRNDALVVEAKGIYSIENFLMARRLMYWQVYLHKTCVACEKMLINTLLRAKELAARGVELFATPALHYFLYRPVDRAQFLTDRECIRQYLLLDDSDIWTALKAWTTHPDTILATLSRGLVDRRLFKVQVRTTPIGEEEIAHMLERIARHFHITTGEARYFISISTIENNMYSTDDEKISILFHDGSTKDIAEASDMLDISLLSRRVTKQYVCYLRLPTDGCV